MRFTSLNYFDQIYVFELFYRRKFSAMSANNHNLTASLNYQYLVTPFKETGHLSNEQIYFNTILSKCRQIIEREIGLLKGRFRRFESINCHNHTDVVMYINAVCVLHNNMSHSAYAKSVRSK